MKCLYCKKEIVSQPVYTEEWGDGAFCNWGCAMALHGIDVGNNIKVPHLIKVLSIVGTRPELIKMSEVIKKLDKYTNHIFVHTNQSYDYTMNQIFFDQLNIRKPDYLLDVKADTVGEQIGNVLKQTEQVMLKENPDALVILGDTNSCLSAIIAKRLRIPIFHLEAGNRAFDERVPEEINRRIVDVTSDINMCYTEHARRNLLNAGLPPQNIFVIGSPLPEIYAVHKNKIDSSYILDELKLTVGNYIVASLHREENVSSLKSLDNLIQTLYALSEKYKRKIIFTTHPRTQHNLNILQISSDSRIMFCQPFGMADYIKLEQKAFITITDSGTSAEDAAILGLPIVHLREANERPEAYDAGDLVMCKDTDDVINAVGMVREQVDSGVKFTNTYGNELNNSDKVVRLIVGLHRIIKQRLYGG
jgi:UDP-N-acetylglucosamine 2-epimerase (non-hydrolysing)